MYLVVVFNSLVQFFKAAYPSFGKCVRRETKPSTLLRASCLQKVLGLHCNIYSELLKSCS